MLISLRRLKGVTKTDFIYSYSSFLIINDFLNLYLTFEFVFALNANEITVMSCYAQGFLTELTDFNNTINLGIQPVGNYTINFVAVLSNDFMTCVPYDSNSVEVMFEVTSTTDITETDRNEIEIFCYPNPVENQNVRVQSDELIDRIELIDIHGRLILGKDNLNVNQYELEMINLPPGTYFVKVTDSNNKRNALEKILKLK